MRCVFFPWWFFECAVGWQWQLLCWEDGYQHSTQHLGQVLLAPPTSSALLSPPALRFTCASPALSPVHLLSNVLDSLLMENLTLTESVTPFTVGMKLAASPPPSLHYWGWQGSLQSVSSIPFIPLRSPSSTSPRHMCPLWNGNPAPLKNVNLEQITAALMLM